MDIQGRIKQLKTHFERGYNARLSKEQPQMKRWWKELYSLNKN